MALMVPLPEAVRNLTHQITHPGLLLDKYVRSWDPQADTGKLSERVQRPALEEVVRLAQKEPVGLDFAQLSKRWREILGYRRAVGFRAKTVGPLTLHLARASALENAGICLHSIYGFVYMPGTGLKGMARSFAETIWLPVQTDQRQAWRQIEDVFGWAPNPDRRAQINDPNHPAQLRRQDETDPKSPEIQASSGNIVFYDAWPTSWPTLIVDIVNNHHSHYYTGRASKLDDQGLCNECEFPPDDPNAHPPGDWENPVPVYFLAVPEGQTFQFALGKWRDDVPDDLLELALEWLIGALEYQGAGAKTAAGYGAFQITEPPTVLGPPAQSPPVQIQPPQISGEKATQGPSAAWQKVKEKKLRCEFTCTLELVTPAFLAGAEQGAKDCDLRPATLRGLLRWWWRTMHAGHVDARTLAQLESAVWGNTSLGAAVGIRIQPLSKIRCYLYDKKEIQKENELPSPPDKKTTPGLWYFSFGMDDVRREENDQKRRFQRYFFSPGTKWQIRLIARPSVYQIVNEKGKVIREIPLPDPQILLQQAEAALWLLCQYGGVGSKSRKGYGCFATPPELEPWTIDQCKRAGQEFRKICEITPTGPCGSPPLEDLEDNELQVEIATPWTNYWFVLDRIGAAAQEFAKRHKHSLAKKALGLPRNIGKPVRDSFQPGNHVQKTDRHASPLLYHVVRLPDGNHTIRIVAFPSPELPSDPMRQKSRDFLQQAIEHVKTQLAQWLKDDNLRAIGQKPPRLPSAATGKPAASPPSSSQRSAPPLRKDDRVEVTIVRDPKGKGRLFGRHEPSGLVGPIQNADRLPKRPEIGEYLTVAVVSISVTGKEIQFRVLEESKK